MATLKKLTRVGADVRQIARLLQAKAPEGHMLAYITPEEAKLLKSQGGSGHLHEDTGIPSFEQFYGIDEAAAGAFEPDYPLDEQPTSVSTLPVASSGQIETTSTEKFVPQYSYPTVEPMNAPARIGLGGVSAGTPLATQVEAPYMPQNMTFGVQTRVPTETGGLPSAMTMGADEPQVIDTAREPSKTIGEKYNELAKNLGISSEQLGRLGIAGVGALYNAYQSNKAQRETEAAKKEQQALGAPYQKKGAELQRAAQAGELTPEGQRQLQAVQAQAAQQAASRGGAVGQAQIQAQVEAFRSQLLQQQYDYGLKLSGIGDQVALGAIKTGLEADRYIQGLNNSFYTNMANIVGGMPSQQQRTA